MSTGTADICVGKIALFNVYYVKMGIRKPPNYLDGFMSEYLYPNRYT